jgi:hypothetical protein
MAVQGRRSPRVDSVTVCSAAFFALLGLKLAGVIGWSWWLVTLPLWGQIAIPILWLAVLFGGSRRLDDDYLAQVEVRSFAASYHPAAEPGPEDRTDGGT